MGWTDAPVVDHGPRRPDLELRRAKLRFNFGRWLAGTEGVIVDAFERVALVEIANDNGETLDLLAVPYSVLRVERKHVR